MVSRRTHFLILAGLVFLGACATVPVTGRRALIFIPDFQVEALAVDSYRQLLKESKLSGDAGQTDMVRRVGQRIAAVSHRPGFDWEFNVIDDDKTINAFAMPGGKVAFYTGILAVCQNDTGVAVVMGHEVAHAIAKHGSERMSQQVLLNFGQMTLEQAMKEKPEKTRALAHAAFGLGAGVGLVLPHGRLQESEADRIGLMYMAEAGYDPREAVKFWQRMDALSQGKSPPEFLSTHPSHQTRIQNLQKWMPEALEVYEKSPHRQR